MDKKKRLYLYGAITVAIILVDQIIKILVKTNMYLGQDIPLLGDWCHLHFIENEGFAFGTSFGGVAGKIALTLFRLVASGIIVWFIYKHLKDNGRASLIACLSVLLGGALGNLVDSLFYGLVFDSSAPYQVATLFPPEGGYAPLFQGKVVDMFYFPLFEFNWPQWMPFVGGKHFEFFSAIFNLADAAITIGTIWLAIELAYHASKGSKEEKEEKKS